MKPQTDSSEVMVSPRSGVWRLSLLVTMIVAQVVLAGCGGSSDSGAEPNFSGNAYFGIDRANTRFVKAEINKGNVTDLEEAWSHPLEARGPFGSYASTPMIVNGVIYSQDIESNVEAIDLESGEVLWSKEYDSPSHGPNGLAVSDGHVYGMTATEAFALDQRSGKEVWSTDLGGLFDMAPGVDDGKVYVSTVAETAASEYEEGVIGAVWALDGDTGRKIWRFGTAPKGLWGNKSMNSSGGLWYPPSFDAKGFVYAGTGNPGPLPGAPGKPWGSSRPGPNLYTSSMIKLNPANGKLVWHYQETPHALYDWDFQNPPILTKAEGRDVAIGSGKSGFVVAVDRKTGKPIWRTSVGIHNGHDKDGLYAMRGEYDKIKREEVFPGALGGVIAPPATDGERVYVPVINHSMTVVSGTEVTESSSIAGEVVALDIDTGGIIWQQELDSPAYGALLAVNDLVFSTSGEGTVRAFEGETGNEVWQETLPAGANAGVMVSGDMLVVAAGLPGEGQAEVEAEEEEDPQLVAYALGG